MAQQAPVLVLHGEGELQRVIEDMFVVRDAQIVVIDLIGGRAVQLMQKLELKSRDNFRKMYLLPALERSLITMSVPDKPTSRNQSYIRK